jgi:predicted transcriptional regulator
VAALPGMLELDRKRAGWSVGRVAWELGVSIREYRELEAGTGWPTSEVWHRICELYGWPQTFAGGRRIA